MLITHILLYIKGLKCSRVASVLLCQKRKIKEKLDVQIFVCSSILGSIKISSINYVFFPLLSNFYKSKSSKTLSEHWHSQTVNHWIYDGIAYMNYD